MAGATPFGADRRHLALVGLSGTGKSTVAPLVAARLGFAVEDVDRRLETRFGSSVADVFRTRGEAAFREAEAEELSDVLAGEPAVVATGGGIVVDGRNRRVLSERCVVVWLRSDVGTLVDRLTGSDEERPLLAEDPESTLRRLAEEREPLYREVADLEIDVGGLHPQQVADAVEAGLRSGGGPTARNAQAPT